MLLDDLTNPTAPLTRCKCKRQLDLTPRVSSQTGNAAVGSARQVRHKAATARRVHPTHP
jgi:hypothetical protein